MSTAFPRSARVRASADYARVFEQARRTSDPLMSLHWLPGDGAARLGLAVSRKVDTRAVGRNRIKRQLREHFRRLRAALPGGDYVVVARTRACARRRIAGIRTGRHNAAGLELPRAASHSFFFDQTGFRRRLRLPA